MTPEVAIVVLNWNNARDTADCLQSLLQLNYPAYSIVVVDNASADDSVQAIRQRYPDVTILETQRNLGYAGGNNLGIRYALAAGVDHIWILNNDVTVAPDSLAQLVTALRAEREVGAATPLVAEMLASEKVWALGMTVNRRTGVVRRLHAGEAVAGLEASAPLEVSIASGEAMLVKREVLERVGLLDDRFFLYYEEADWCLRARRAGYRILAVPSSVVWHKVSSTLGQTSPVIDYYMLRNHLLFLARYWSGAARPYLIGRTTVRNLLTIAAYTVKSRGGRRLPHRNARLFALRDAIQGHWGKMGPDVEKVCYPGRK